MYRYTPNPSYVRVVQRPKCGYRPSHWATVERFITAHFPNLANSDRYTIHSRLVCDFEKVDFYSPTKLAAIPVMGVLFPSDLFDEIEIPG